MCCPPINFCPFCGSSSLERPKQETAPLRPNRSLAQRIADGNALRGCWCLDCDRLIRLPGWDPNLDGEHLKLGTGFDKLIRVGIGSAADRMPSGKRKGRPRGRKPLGEPWQWVSVPLPLSLLERLTRASHAIGTVENRSEFIRVAIARYVADIEANGAQLTLMDRLYSPPKAETKKTDDSAERRQRAAR